MQNRVESILRNINRVDKSYNILTFATHESFQSQWATLPHAFYLIQGQGIKTWENQYRQLPKNHILLDGGDGQIKPDIKIDAVLSQNKMAHFKLAQQIAQQLNVPLITLEHTLPPPDWNIKILEDTKKYRGKINVYISEYSTKAWDASNEKTTVVIRHGINTDLFKPKDNDRNNDGKILTVANLYPERDWCLGFNLYQRVTKELPVNPVGNSPGFSKAANDIDDLISKYQNCSVFFNSSLISPLPMSLMEACAVGCPIVTTATAMIPEIFNKNNSIISNNENQLRSGLEWCLNNPDKARQMGNRARETALEKFNLDSHLKAWNEVFELAIRK